MLSEADVVEKQNNLDKEIEELEDQRIQISNKLKQLKQEKEELRIQYSLNRLKTKSCPSLWTNESFPWTEEVNLMLTSTFKFKDFRPCQLAAINATLSKKDVLLIMPTGGGKSLVYQLPSLVTGNLTVVISPLISLIEDQLMALDKLGIVAGTINSTTPKEENKEITKKMLSNKLRIIFVTPECIAKSKVFLKNLMKIYRDSKLTRFIIDEVHCCSQWGHDFRTDYMSLSLLTTQFTGVPILGLTATATPHVLVDIQKILQIPDSVVISSPYNRPNLFYKVVAKPDDNESRLEYLETLLKGKYQGQSGIIYVGTQRECHYLNKELRKKDLRVAPYYSNLEPSLKSKIHKKWTGNMYQAVIATIAFGLGIDKPDVRFVIHYSVPKSLEGLYQESGRAGRDGKAADCILMFSLSDWLRNFALAKTAKDEKMASNMLQYCINISMCRRKLISNYFDDEWRASDCKQMCDHCTNGFRPIYTYHLGKCLIDVLNIVNNASNKEVNLTLKKLLDCWFQIGPKLLDITCSKPKFTRDQAEHIIAYLLNKKIIIVRRGYSLVTSLAYIDTNFEPPFRMEYFGEKIFMRYDQVLKGVDLKTTEGPPSEPSISSVNTSEDESWALTNKLTRRSNSTNSDVNYMTDSKTDTDARSDENSNEYFQFYRAVESDNKSDDTPGTSTRSRKRSASSYVSSIYTVSSDESQDKKNMKLDLNLQFVPAQQVD